MRCADCSHHTVSECTFCTTANDGFPKVIRRKSAKSGLVESHLPYRKAAIQNSYSTTL
jgi:hypothetical protein